MSLLPRETMYRLFLPWGIAMALGGMATVVHAQNTETCQDIYKEKVRQIDATYIGKAKNCHGDSVCLTEATNDKAAQVEKAGKKLYDCNKCPGKTIKGKATKGDWGDWNKRWDRTLEGLYNKIKLGLDASSKKGWRFEWKFDVKVLPDGTVEAELDRQSSTWIPSDSLAARLEFNDRAAYLEKNLETIRAPFPEGSKNPFVRLSPLFSSIHPERKPSPPVEEVEDACPPEAQ